MPDAPDLDKLKADQKKLQDDIAALNAKAASVQAAIKAAETQAAEIAKATEGYDKAVAEMQREHDDDVKVIAKKRSLAELEIADLKGPIDQKITDFDKSLADRSEAATAAADAALKAVAAAAAAAQDWQDEQAAFAALKNEPKAMAGRLKDLKALLDDIARAESQDDAVALYFYVAEAAGLAAQIAITAPDAYLAQLVAAQADVEKARIGAVARKSDSDKANAAAAAARKAKDTAVASRRVDLLKVLRTVKAPAPA